MKSIFIVSNNVKDAAYLLAEEIAAYLRAQGVASYVKRDDGDVPDENTDCILVLGGDGTMLRAVGQYAEMEIPFLGINLGNVGYLTEADKDGWKGAIDQLLAGNYDVEKRMMLRGSAIKQSGSVELSMTALNDIAITRAGLLQMLSFSVYVNEQFLSKYYADGILVCTPTGSTGYNLSAGGPIVEPSARLLLLTPICSHSLNNSSIVLSPDDKIRIEIEKRRDGECLSVDACYDGGDRTVNLKSGDSLLVEADSLTAGIVRLSKSGFLETLKRKIATVG